MSEAVQGAIIGGLMAIIGSWIAIVVTSRAETRRHLHRLGLELATIEWRRHIESAAQMAKRTGTPQPMPPPFLYFYSNYRFIEVMSAGAVDDAAKIANAILDQQKIIGAVSKILEAEQKKRDSGLV